MELPVETSAFPDLSTLVDSITTAILTTLAYYDQFDRPLAAAELAERLIGWEATEASIAAEILSSHRLRKEIVLEQGHYALGGRPDLIQRYLSLASVREEKWRRLERFARIVQYVPFVRCIIAAGSLAKGSARSESDIDFVCLTADGRLWIARTGVATLCCLWNWARRPSDLQPEQDKIDVLAMHSLGGLENPHQTLYAALSMHDEIVLYDEKRAAHRFAESNGWLRAYFPRFTTFRHADHSVRSHPMPSLVKRSLEWLLSLPAADSIELRVYQWWCVRWQKHWATQEWEAREGMASPYIANFKSYYWESRAMSHFMERLRALGVPDATH